MRGTTDTRTTDTVMKAYEFTTRLNANNTVSVPAEVVAQIREPEQVRVIVLIDESEDEAGWKQLTAEQFFHGYDEGDAIYDRLSSR